MTVFLAQSDIDPVTKKPKLSLGSEHNRARFADYLRANPKIRFRIEPLTPESKKQRGFYEGAVVPLIAYYQEGFDHTSNHDCQEVRGWLAREFNGEMKEIGGELVKVAKSTKGQLNKGFLERVLDWMNEQGYKTELLMPEDYKNWKAKIFPFGGPENYIDYLLQIGKLR